jgi:mono/diheme cytochrome c family protein
MFDGIYKLLEQLGYPHPIHPTEVHMPIGLIVGALILCVSGRLWHRPALLQAAHYCTIIAGLFLLPTILFGLMDWQHFYSGAWLYPIKVKLALAPALLVLVGLSIFLVQKKGIGTPMVLPNYTASFIAVVFLGYFGGDLVYADTKNKGSDPLAAGREVFDANCVACHANGGNVIVPALPLLNSSYTKSPAALLAFIRNPRLPGGASGPMRAFPVEKISDRQAGDLYNYIASGLGR